jgi:hypothetical protein
MNTPLVTLTAACALLLTSGCSSEGPDLEAQGAQDPAPTSFKDLIGGPQAASEPGNKPTLPILAFEANSENLPDTGTWRGHPLLADLDGDGKADLVASNREEDGLSIWRSVPGEAWILKREGITDDLMYGGSDSGDLDGDGDVDVLFAAHKRGLHTLLNDGNMNWELLTEPTVETFLGLDVALGNLNGDEHLDAVTVAQFVTRRRGALGVYLGRGDGTFEYVEALRDTTGVSRNGSQIELYDLDGDGLDDIFLTAEWSCLLLMTRLSDDGHVQLEDRSTGLPKPPTNMGNTMRAFVPMDVDGDGQLEVAFACLSDMRPADEPPCNTLGVLRWNEAGKTWEQYGSGLPVGLAYTDVITEDFDGDSHADLLVIGPGLGASIYLGDGKGGFQVKGMLEGTRAGGRSAVGDIDGDGKPDVVVIQGDTKSRPDAGCVKTFLNRDEAW